MATREHGTANHPVNRHPVNRPARWAPIPSGSNKRRLLFESLLNSRLSRSNTIAMNQHYIENVMENPKTPIESKRIAFQYVMDHPERFLMLNERRGSDELNEWAGI